MQPALDSSTLDRLISLGRERGHLTTEDLRASLPVETMSAEDIALIIVHLEETGVSVELEDSLLSPDPKPAPRQSAEIIPFPGPRAAQRKAPKAHFLQPAQTPLPHPHQPGPQNSRMAHWVIAAAGCLAFVVFSLIIFATAG